MGDMDKNGWRWLRRRVGDLGDIQFLAPAVMSVLAALWAIIKGMAWWQVLLLIATLFLLVSAGTFYAIRVVDSLRKRRTEPGMPRQGSRKGESIEASSQEAETGGANTGPVPLNPATLWRRPIVWLLLIVVLALGVGGSEIFKARKTITAEILEAGVNEWGNRTAIGLFVGLGVRAKPTEVKEWRGFLELSNGRQVELLKYSLVVGDKLTIAYEDGILPLTASDMIINMTTKPLQPREYVVGFLPLVLPDTIPSDILRRTGIIIKVTFEDSYDRSYELTKEFGTASITNRAPFYNQLPIRLERPAPDTAR